MKTIFLLSRSTDGHAYTPVRSYNAEAKAEIDKKFLEQNQPDTDTKFEFKIEPLELDDTVPARKKKSKRKPEQEDGAIEPRT